MNRKTVLFRDGLAFLAVTIAIFIGSVIREVNLLLFFASLLTCFLFLDRILGKRSLRNLLVTRQLPGAIYAGDSFLMTVICTNSRKKDASWGLVIEDRITPVLQSAEENGASKSRELLSLAWRPVCYFDRVDPSKEEKKTYAGQLPLRGRYRLGPMTVTTRFPLGFFRSSLPVKEEGDLVVFPKIGKLSRNWLREYNREADRQTRWRTRVSRCGDEPLGVRRWQTGDVRKWIHWRASAKHREIFVRQFQERRHHDTAIILDLFYPDALTPESFENLELSISFAATLVKQYITSHTGNLSLICGQHDDQTGGKTGFALYHTLMTRLATAQPVREDHLLDAFARLSSLDLNDTDIILVTAIMESGNSSQRLDALFQNPLLARLLAKTQVIDVSSPAFDEIFQVTVQGDEKTWR